MLGQDLYLVDEGPEADTVLPHTELLPLPLGVTHEGPEVAGLAQSWRFNNIEEVEVNICSFYEYYGYSGYEWPMITHPPSMA